jgi:subtilisin family serine protease
MSIINIDVVHSQRRVDGNGITVAVLDSGCCARHETFSSDRPGLQRVLEGRNFTGIGSDTDTSDSHGHGTAVASIIAGNLNASGVAPGARILPLKVAAAPGQVNFSHVLEALKWLVSKAKALGPNVACLSLGDRGNFGSTTEALKAGGPVRAEIADKILELRTLQIPTVAAVGNSFFAPDSSKLGMCFPAIMPECISVGAVFADDSYFNETFVDCGCAFVHQSRADRITPFSQRMPKVDGNPHFTRLFAPGAPVEAAAITSNAALVAGLAGTSVAAPFAAGVIALLQQKFSSIRGELPSCDDLERWLVNGAKTIVDAEEGLDRVTHDGSTYKVLDAAGEMDSMLRDLAVS